MNMDLLDEIKKIGFKQKFDSFLNEHILIYGKYFTCFGYFAIEEETHLIEYRAKTKTMHFYHPDVKKKIVKEVKTIHDVINWLLFIKQLYKFNDEQLPIVKEVTRNIIGIILYDDDHLEA